ncbi:MAG: hypothetical protein DAHOPDDO_01691 [Ignavibacteriaceae bacterium]|nr:hypothetical protein [Ignavibacteriaceae bacterium]
MTKEEFNIINDFILENLKKENPFRITTSVLFKVINYNIQFRSGHKALYDSFIKYCVGSSPTYKVKSFWKSESYDKQFDIEFRL